jgi:hypothetical protein
MAKVNDKGRLKASSILEVVVSMVIIIMVLGISLMIYTNVMRQSLSSRRLKAQFLLHQQLLKVKPDAVDMTLTIDDWQIEQKVSIYEEGSPLIQVHLIAFDVDHYQIAEVRKVILGNDHE